MVTGQGTAAMDTSREAARGGTTLEIVTPEPGEAILDHSYVMRLDEEQRIRREHSDRRCAEDTETEAARILDNGRNKECLLLPDEGELRERLDAIDVDPRCGREYRPNLRLRPRRRKRRGRTRRKLSSGNVTSCLAEYDLNVKFCFWDEEGLARIQTNDFFFQCPDGVVTTSSSEDSLPPPKRRVISRKPLPNRSPGKLDIRSDHSTPAALVDTSPDNTPPKPPRGASSFGRFRGSTQDIEHLPSTIVTHTVSRC